MEDNQTMYQVSTLQALSMGYTRPVITVGELLGHGDTGLGTYADLNGELILVDGNCYQANVNGVVRKMPPETGVSFCSVSFLERDRHIKITEPMDIDALQSFLNIKIEERFGLNCMHITRIEGYFEEITARSEVPYRSHHIELKDILEYTQNVFVFKKLKGTLIGVYYPDYMDSLNQAGWHFHFVSEGRTLGGHVFDLRMAKGEAFIDKIRFLQIQLPWEPAFDTYSLKK